MKKILSLFLAAVCTLQMTGVFAGETILKNIVLHSWDFSNKTQITTDEQAVDQPILSGGSEYNPDNENIRLNAKSESTKVLVNLEKALVYADDENIINIEFDMNFGSITGQSFMYSIASTGGDRLIDFRFEPYKDNGTAYIKIGGNDVIADIINDDGTVNTSINRQIKNCVTSNNGDGMAAEITHFRNEINLALGTATVYITSGKKYGDFAGVFNKDVCNNVASLDMSTTKSGSARHSYVDNIKISQWQNVEAPKPDELVHVIAQEADGDLTVVDTSKMVYGGHVSAFLVTTAKNGELVKQYTTDIADSVAINTQNADSIEISPVYTYTAMNDKVFNTDDGVTLSDINVLNTIADGRYDISIQKADGKLTDIYINGNMVANNVEQTGKGRGTPKGSLYTANDIKIEGGSIRINTQRDEWNGRTYPTAPISDITIKKSPSIVTRKTKITILGDSLVCDYYGGRRESDLGSNQTGWGQQLPNFINTDKYEIVNLANSGHYAKILYETAMGGAIANSVEGDIIICQCGYNDRVRSDEEEMVKYMTKMAEDANTAGIKMIFVSPPATCDDETKYNASGNYKNPIDTTAEDYVNTSYSYPVRYGRIVKETAENLGAEFIDLSKFSYDYMTMLYGADINNATDLYVKNLGVSDKTHLSYAGAMKWASFIAQNLYDNNLISSINKEFTYSQTDTLGNDIMCSVSENKQDIFNRFTISGDDENINITVMAHTEGIVYAAMYKKDGSLINVKSVKESSLPQTMTLSVTHDNGAYIKLFNWTDEMKPVCGASDKINVEGINVDYSYKALNGKIVYAFGDSIVYGHNAPKQSFMQLIADDYGMNLNMLAKNGATVVTADSYSKEDPEEETKDNYIINQIKGAPAEAPDVIIFDGYTNDAYGDKATDSFNSNGAHINIWDHLGEIQGKDAAIFDTSTFCGGFEKILYEMKKKWPDTPIVFVTIHKSGGRDWDTQCKLRELSLEICAQWGVDTADIFKDTNLDTRDEGHMKQYIINGAGSHPNVSACREFYIPVVSKKLNEVLSRPVYKLPDNIDDTVDLAIFAGQSNMSGRGKAEDATVCDINAGFEYKSVSNPLTLVPIAEPFGLGEDREGAIEDFNSDGTTKRTGSMVSSVADEYYKKTGRQLVAVSASIGGTSTSEWKNKYIGDAVQRLDDAINFLEANKINVGRIFVVWCQGESDGDNNVSASVYTSNTKELFNSFKQHGAENCFMIQIGHYRDGGTMDTRYGVIRDAQAELCENNADFVLAGSFEPYRNDMKDKYHYNQSTYNAVGKTVGENISKFYGVN